MTKFKCPGCRRLWYWMANRPHPKEGFCSVCLFDGSYEWYQARLGFTYGEYLAKKRADRALA